MHCSKALSTAPWITIIALLMTFGLANASEPMHHVTAANTAVQALSPADWSATFRSWEQAYRKRDYASAEKVLRNALNVIDTSKQYGSYLPETLTDLITTYYAEGKLTEAKPLYQRSLSLVERKRGANSQALATALANYAELLRRLGQRKEADSAQQRANAIAKALGSTTYTATGRQSPTTGTKPGQGAAGATPISGSGGGGVVELSDAEFDEKVIHSNRPVLIDFYATWCGPCQRMSPVIDELAAAYGNKIRVFRVDVDKNPALSSKFNIRGIPTFMTFKNGSARSSETGVVPAETIRSRLDSLLN